MIACLMIIIVFTIVGIIVFGIIFLDKEKKDSSNIRADTDCTPEGWAHASVTDLEELKKWRRNASYK